MQGNDRVWGRSLMVALLLLVCAPAWASDDPAWLVRGSNGMVASDSEQASQAGLELLQAGGNAVDAAAAVSFALGVTRPYSTGLGGGGFMIIRFADGRVVTLDYREVAPADARPELFTPPAPGTADKDATPPPSLYGARAAGVPGVLAGWDYAVSHFGRKGLSSAIEPAYFLANHQITFDEHYAKAARSALRAYEKYPQLIESCNFVYRTYLGEGTPPETGFTLRQTYLASLLNALMHNGTDFFYRGKIAADLAEHARQHGGLLSVHDFDTYRVRVREALRFTYRDYELITMPPPSSGGVALAESLNILETFDLPRLVRADPALATHLRVEALKHAFADRARWLGDPDFVDVPVALLTSKDYARARAGAVSRDSTSPTEAYGTQPPAGAAPASPPSDSGTSHFCVADRWGNVVVATETINGYFGSLSALDRYGLILNNNMDDFTTQAGTPNLFGLLQSQRNAVAPGKRPLSSMSPTIVLKQGEPFLLIGGSGGPRIISSVLNVFLYLADYGLDPAAAMTRLRPHHQWQPEELFFDQTPPAPVAADLKQRGHDLAEKARSGVVQFILRTPQGWVGASDPRKGGRPAGY